MSTHRKVIPPMKRRYKVVRVSLLYGIWDEKEGKILAGETFYKRQLARLTVNHLNRKERLQCGTSE